MAREYIKLPDGTLQEIDRARVREFASVDCVKKAIADGDLQPGDAWATICHTTVLTDDIASEVYRVLSYIPETTNSTDNKLLNHCDLTTEIEEISKRVMCTDFQTYVETAGVDIADRVCCSDYNTCVGNMQSAITTLEGKPGLDCVGTVTSITVNGASYNPTSGVVSLPNYPPDLSSCAGLACTGTLTASDISDMATQTWVNNCGFSKATFSLSGNVLTITTA